VGRYSSVDKASDTICVGSSTTCAALPRKTITEIDPGLRDCDYGAWTGRELSKVQLDQPKDVAAWLTDPCASPHGGESILQLIVRI
jgi:broad specificity phosphatase PhoE